MRAKLAPGDGMRDAEAYAERLRASLDGRTAREARRDHDDGTPEQNEQHQRDLKAETRERHPEWFR